MSLHIILPTGKIRRYSQRISAICGLKIPTQNFNIRKLFFFIGTEYPKHLLRLFLGAQILGKEFPASAPQVVQGAIKFLSPMATRGQWLLKPKTSEFTARPKVNIKKHFANEF